MNSSQYRLLISGQQRGWHASLLRGLLSAGAVPYAGAMRLRNLLYDAGLWRVQRVDVPVISVGNLTLGGTGKTPMVQWLAQWFLRRGVRVALISRGYGAGNRGRNDEAAELAQRLEGVPHLQDPDRVRAARRAIRDHRGQVLLLDDAFQHRRLGRDLDLVLLDALDPWGGGRVFPRGTLREPAAGLRRADVVALSRSDAVAAEQREAIRRRAAQLAPQAVWLELIHRPVVLTGGSGQQAPLASLAGRRVAAFCGIGNPAGFRFTLQTCGYELAAFREFPDHHAYGHHELAELDQWASEQSGVAAVLCTAKDLTKIDRDQLGSLPLWALTVEMEIRHGAEELQNLLRRLVPSPVPSPETGPHSPTPPDQA